MPDLKIGAPYIFMPSAFTGERAYPTEEDRSHKLTGKIVWIHPRKRFFLVEAPCHGHTIRECFYMDPKGGIKA